MRPPAIRSFGALCRPPIMPCSTRLCGRRPSGSPGRGPIQGRSAAFKLIYRSFDHELDEAGYRTTSPPKHEADDWVLLTHTTNDERGIPANKPQWKPRVRSEAYQAAENELSRFISREAVHDRVQ